MIICDNLKLDFITKISEHQYIDQNGYLVCQDSILGRTGIQKYRGKEIGISTIGVKDGDVIVDVYRDEEDVFDPISLASLEGRPLTNTHPKEAVTSKNHSRLAKGFVRNVRHDNNAIIGDLVVQDEDTIKLIQNGSLKELSLGYSTDFVYDDEIGKYKQTNIIYNHIALVKHGRAGISMIVDEDTTRKENNELEEKKVEDGCGKDNEVIETEETEKVKDEEVAKKDEVEKKVEDSQITLDALMKEINSLKEVIKGINAKDNAYEQLKEQIKEIQVEKKEDKEESILKIKDENTIIEPKTYDPERHELEMIKYFKKFNPNAHDSIEDYNKFIKQETRKSIVENAIDRKLNK